MPIFKSTHEQLIKDSLAKLNENLKDVGEDQDNMFDVVATTEDVDRDGETIMVDGWQTDNWFKNPVILSNHWYTVQNIVGKGLEFYKDEKGRMRLKGVFTEATEAGRICKALYNGGFLKAVSVGFIIKQRNEVDRLIIEKAELLEVSFVAVPCNPEALSQDGKLYKKGIELGIIKEVDQEDDEEDDG